MRNPFVWLWRIRHRCGYGIHSPFAYNLVTQVLYCPGCYYADEDLYSLSDRVLHPRRTAIRKLLFRLANYWQPDEIVAPTTLHPFLHEGCQKANLRVNGNTVALKGEKGEIQVILDMGRDWKRWLKNPHTTLTFDLYDVGIVFLNLDMNRQDYIINW